MIKYDELLTEDLFDDLEYLGKDRNDFSINILIGKSPLKAFIFGYHYDDWKTKLWIPISIRKKMRHLHEEINQYLPQIQWLNDKIKMEEGIEVDVVEYTNYLLDNMFIDNENDLLNLAMGIGRVLKNKRNETSTNLD